MDLLKEYDISVVYHTDRANIVVDALSLMTLGSVSHVEDKMKEPLRDVHRLSRLGVKLVDSSKVGFTVHHSSESSVVVDVKSKQHLDFILMKLKDPVLTKFVEAFSQGGDGVLRYHGRLCVPDTGRSRI